MSHAITSSSAALAALSSAASSHPLPKWAQIEQAKAAKGKPVVGQIQDIVKEGIKDIIASSHSGKKGVPSVRRWENDELEELERRKANGFSKEELNGPGSKGGSLRGSTKDLSTTPNAPPGKQLIRKPSNLRYDDSFFHKSSPNLEINGVLDAIERQTLKQHEHRDELGLLKPKSKMKLNEMAKSHGSLVSDINQSSGTSNTNHHHIAGSLGGTHLKAPSKLPPMSTSSHSELRADTRSQHDLQNGTVGGGDHPHPLPKQLRHLKSKGDLGIFKSQSSLTNLAPVVSAGMAPIQKPKKILHHEDFDPYTGRPLHPADCSLLAGTYKTPLLTSNNLNVDNTHPASELRNSQISLLPPTIPKLQSSTSMRSIAIPNTTVDNLISYKLEKALSNPIKLSDIEMLGCIGRGSTATVMLANIILSFPQAGGGGGISRGPSAHSLVKNDGIGESASNGRDGSFRSPAVSAVSMKPPLSYRFSDSNSRDSRGVAGGDDQLNTPLAPQQGPRKIKKPHAIKIMRKHDLMRIPGGVKRVLKEREILMSLSHPFIVKYVDCLQDEKKLYIITEYVPTNLRHVMDRYGVSITPK
jgi:hypothetical protein